MFKRILISALIGTGICILCILPPMLHFLTGPLGPLIGGFVGGLRIKAKWTHAIFIGLTMGLCLAALFLLIINLIVSLQVSIPEVMQKFVSPEALNASMLKYSLIPLSYVGVLGTLGAWIGGKIMNRKTSA